jgi:hypothetical protein
LLCNGQTPTTTTTTTTTTHINNNNLTTSTTNTLINTNYFKKSNKTQINKSINKGILDSGAQNAIILTINTCVNNDLPIKQNQNTQTTIKWGNGNNKTKTNLATSISNNNIIVYITSS